LAQRQVPRKQMPDSLPDNKTNKKRQTEADRETGQAASQTHRQKQSDQNKQNKKQKTDEERQPAPHAKNRQTIKQKTKSQAHK